MSSVNKIMLIGRVTAQPEQRYTQQGTAVTNFNLAVNRHTKKDEHPEADFIPITAWQKLAEICGQYLQKGQLVYVEGRLNISSYVDSKTNEKRKKTTVIASDMRMLGKKSDNASQESAPPQEASWGPEQFDQAAAAMEDDVPF